MSLNGIYNNYLDDIRHGRDHDKNFMNPAKAQFVMDQLRAEDGLILISQIEDYKNHNQEMEVMIRDKDNEIEKQKRIIDKFVETFGKYEMKQLHGYSSETDIIMPETNSYKFYKKVFYETDKWSNVKPGNKINLSIEVNNEGYNILSRKVTPIKVKEEKITPKKNIKGKKK